jgi:hypothetical protein
MLPQWPPGRSLRPAAGRITLNGMADTREHEITDELRAFADEHSLGPEDLVKLPDYLKLAKELGIELKELLFNTNTSAITIVNRTAHTLHFLREIDRVSGAFKTLPPDQIAPGETGSFLSGESSGILNALKGDDAKVVYSVGDDASFCQWTMHWNNPEAADPLDPVHANEADSFLSPRQQTLPDGTVVEFEVVEEWAQNGSTLVPFQFVIRDDESGGRTDGVVDKNSCVITVLNETEQSLFLMDVEFNDGDIVTFPADEIPSEGETTFTVSEKLRPDHRREGVTGYARYTVTQDFQHALWTLQWHNPEVGENIAQNTLDGASAGLYQAGPPMMPSDQKENTPVRFVLRDAGGGGGGTTPPQPKPREEPPPETDEPTLRHGDQSVDGWVEYLQTLLEHWGHGPVPHDGDFEDTTLGAVRAFQRRMKATNPGVMVDGIVGHQTWALLREEDPRPPSTDGREPHTYVEHGPEARWNREDEGILYDTNQDWLAMGAFVVGDVSIEASQHTAVADFTPVGGGATIQLELEMFAADGHTAQEHEHFSFGLRNVSTHLTEGVTYDVHAWMHSDLGGDDVNGRFTV